MKKGRERGEGDEKNHPAWRKNLKIKQTKMWGRCGREKRERERIQSKFKVGERRLKCNEANKRSRLKQVHISVDGVRTEKG